MIINKYTLIRLIVDNYVDKEDSEYYEYLLNKYANMNTDDFDEIVNQSFNNKIKKYGNYYILNQV